MIAVHASSYPNIGYLHKPPFYPICGKGLSDRICQNQHMSDDKEFLQRVRARMKEVGVSQAGMAEALGLPSQSAFSNILTGKRGLYFNEALEIERILMMARADAVRNLPIIGLASASSWNEAVMMPLGHFPVAPGSTGKRSFAVQIKGDSLDQLVPDGGYIVVDPDDRKLYGGKVYLIQNTEDEVTVKRYCSDPSRFEPVSNNSDHKSIDLGDTRIIVIGRAVFHGGPM